MHPTKKISATLVSSSILLGLFGWLLPVSPDVELNKEIYWLRKTFSQEKYNIVIGGDSRVHRGLSPDDLLLQVNEASNAIILGYSSAGYSKDYCSFLLSKLNKEGNTKALILGLTPHSFTPDALENGHFHEVLYTSTADMQKALYLEPFLQFFEPRKISLLFRSTDYQVNGYLEKFHDNGWVESDNLKTDSTRAIKSYSKVFIDNTVNDAAVNDFIVWVDSLSKENIAVLGYRPPTTVTMRSLEDSVSGYNETAIRNAFEASGGQWIDFKDNDFESYDGSHLRAKDARHLSKDIGIEIQGLLK